MLEAALDLAGNGWAVHPCIPTGPKAKSPFLPHGHLEASAEPEAIVAWWTRWPTAMIGAPVPESMLVLDIDPRNGGSIEALESVTGPLPETLTAWSGRGDGGRHLYFRRPVGQFVSTGLPAGVDLKVAGYLIMPPSIHPASGEPYRWEHHPAAQLPFMAVVALRPDEPTRRAPTFPVSSTGKAAKADALVRTVLNSSESTRNNRLYWAACRAIEEGHDEHVLEELEGAAMSVGLGPREAAATINSARRRLGVAS